MVTITALHFYRHFKISSISPIFHHRIISYHLVLIFFISYYYGVFIFIIIILLAHGSSYAFLSLLSCMESLTHGVYVTEIYFREWFTDFSEIEESSVDLWLALGNVENEHFRQVIRCNSALRGLSMTCGFQHDAEDSSVNSYVCVQLSLWMSLRK